jgi:colanic acid/amylovoran biosynthesis glycosyltransferase
MNVLRASESDATEPAQLSQGDGSCLCIAYLVNQYPKISHKFIRREIEALEGMGVRIERFSLRPSGDRFVDEADRSELNKTRTIRGTSPLRLALACTATILAGPARFARALRLAIQVGLGSDRGVLLHLAYLAQACVLYRWFSELKVDHVHAHFATNSAAAAMLCQVLGGPTYSFTAHGPDDFDRARFLRLDEKIRRASFVMTVSSYGRSQLFRWCDHKQWPRIHVLHPGVDDGFLQYPPAPMDAVPRLVCVGRLDEQKGQLLLLEAVHGLAGEGVECELVLVGQGPLRAEIAARIEQLHLNEHVILAGALPTDELYGVIQSSRALILASLAENLPSVILEAYALRRPVIATFIGGIPEVVDPEITGWLVPAGSVEALQRAMRQALQTPIETLERMGEAGARRAANEFRSEVAARRLLQLFRTAVDSQAVNRQKTHR